LQPLYPPRYICISSIIIIYSQHTGTRIQTDYIRLWRTREAERERERERERGERKGERNGEDEENAMTRGLLGKARRDLLSIKYAVREMEI